MINLGFELQLINILKLKLLNKKTNIKLEKQEHAS